MALPRHCKGSQLTRQSACGRVTWQHKKKPLELCPIGERRIRLPLQGRDAADACLEPQPAGAGALHIRIRLLSRVMQHGAEDDAYEMDDGAERQGGERERGSTRAQEGRARSPARGSDARGSKTGRGSEELARDAHAGAEQQQQQAAHNKRQSSVSCCVS